MTTSGPVDTVYAAQPLDDLVTRAQHGDAMAFVILYHRAARALRAYAGPLTTSESECDDLLHRTFVRAWRELPALDRPAAWPAWLLRLADREAENLGHNGHARPSAPLPPPASSAMRRLPARLREVLALRYYFGHDLPAVVSCLAEPLETVERWEREALEQVALFATA